MNDLSKRLLWLSIYAIAMALLEPLSWFIFGMGCLQASLPLCLTAVLTMVRLARGELLGITSTCVGLGVFGGLLALYIFVSDLIHALLQGRSDWDTLRPEPFRWPLFLVALALMAVPALMATWPGCQLAQDRTQNAVAKVLFWYKG